jgi:tetratricopeptide (TPR) repeat protein
MSAALVPAGRIVDYVNVVETLVAAHSEDVGVRLHYAFALLHARRLREASAQLDAALALAPDDPEVLTFVAGVRFGVGEFDLAEECVARVRGMLAGSSLKLRTALDYTEGQLAAYRRDDERARRLLQSAVDTDPKHPDHAFYAKAFARFLSRRGETDAAMLVLRNALADHPDDVELTRMSDVGVGTDLPERDPVFEQLIDAVEKQASGNPSHDLSLVVADLEPGAARVILQEALDSDDEALAAEAATNLAQILSRQGDLAGARAAIQRAMDSADDDQAPVVAALAAWMNE